MIRNCLHNLENIFEEQYPLATPIKAQALLLQDCLRPRQYQKLMDRKKCGEFRSSKTIENSIKKNVFDLQKVWKTA